MHIASRACDTAKIRIGNDSFIFVTIQSPHSQNCLFEAFLLLMCASRHVNSVKLPFASKLARSVFQNLHGSE